MNRREFIKAFGKWGSAPGEPKTRHAMVIDARGRLIVADRTASVSSTGANPFDPGA